MEKTNKNMTVKHDKEAKKVIVFFQIYLIKTDNPLETLVAFDAQTLKYICIFDGHNLSDEQQYVLFKPERPDFNSLYRHDISEYVNELNERRVLELERLVMDVKITMDEKWYDDYARENNLPSLSEVDKSLEDAHEE